MSQNAATAACVVLTLVVVLGMVFWGNSRGRTLLATWAYQNGYEILSQEECLFFRGPFFWSSSKGQKVYKVTVREAEGRVRNGHVRVGGYWLGLFSDDVDVRWSD